MLQAVNLNRGNSLGRLPTSGTCVPDITPSYREDSAADFMVSSAIFPRWASSVMDITRESPFEPPSSLPHDLTHESVDDLVSVFYVASFHGHH